MNLLLPRVRLTFGASKILSFFSLCSSQQRERGGKSGGRRWQVRGGMVFPPALSCRNARMSVSPSLSAKFFLTSVSSFSSFGS